MNKIMFYVYVLWFFVFCEISALKVGDDGVCTVKSSIRRTRSRIVTVQKWCGRKKCIARVPKTEAYYVTTNQTVCCEGWQYKGEEDVCAPHCSTGCLGGQCIAPNVCQCDPPSYLDPEHQNICITPKCDPPCYNADCINNTCHCKQNFNPYNTTHCFQCDTGYTIDSNFNCAPICTMKCENGNCTAPDVCTCLPGFKSNGTDCEPVCTRCVNSKCTAPDTCTCLKGYTQVNNTNCVPKCDKCDGVCVSPNVCKCKEGYTMVDGKCAPVCNESCNGVCTAPNTCTCFDGYKKIDGVCTKPCGEGCKGHCANGRCVEKNCKLSQFVKKTRWVKGKREHYRAKVEKQVCCAGWYFNLKDKSCQAVCSMGCKNGRCVAPDECQCDPPYILKEHDCVMPICNEPCVNAKCVDNDLCVCNPDFERLNSTHCIPNCPEGFINDPITLNCTCHPGFELGPDTICHPICELGCVNASCTAPNICTCFNGYESIQNNTCAPKCDDCENGICIAPNNCQCNNGYTKNSVGKCIPTCSKSCTNGHCYKPETCGCDIGYQLDKDDKYTCRPICKFECVNGTCTSPNKCSCLPGYGGLDTTVCRPKCLNCDHGECIAPNTCMCHEGYNMSNGVCSPVCQDACINGACVSPYNCSCKDGYVKNVTTSHVCYKPCDGLCENGACDLDGNCICDRGFELDNGTCISITPVECSTCNGNCTDMCWCLNGMPCFITTAESAEVASTATLAGLELSWVLAGTVVILLLVVAIVVLQRTWKKNKKNYDNKVPTDYKNGSVLYTVSDTLKRVGVERNDKYSYNVTELEDEDTKSIYENVNDDDREASERLYTAQDTL